MLPLGLSHSDLTPFLFSSKSQQHPAGTYFEVNRVTPQIELILNNVACAVVGNQSAYEQ